MRRSFRHWIPIIGWLILVGPALVPAQDESLAELEFKTVDFERHIAPLLRKHGCNAASCHGAAEGQAGFQLSLFGHDPSFDYESLTADGTGRVDREDPSNSLFLQKPTLTIDHDGGERFAVDSREFHLIWKWVSQGAVHSPGSGRLAAIDISPSRGILTEQRPEVKVRVLATFANGDREDVTRFSEFHLHDDTVATMDGGDVVRRAGQGETVLVAGYAGRSSSLRILVPQAGPKVELDPESSNSMIDRYINARLLELNIEPAPRCSDTTFLRRLMLTTSGRLPTPNQIREFVLDQNPEKRRRVIDTQLADPRHAALWATRMCEITGSRDVGADRVSEASRHEAKWHEWFRTRFEKNRPYDDMVRSILTATTREMDGAEVFLARETEAAGKELLDDESRYSRRSTLDLFWQRPRVNEEVEIESIAERIAAAFLGVRIECARCHQHPFDRWTRNEHRSFVNVFSQVRYGLSPDLRVALVENLERQRELARTGQPTTRIPAVREVYITSTAHDLRDPRTRELLPARPIGGEVLIRSGDRREEFADWLVAEDNPFFARNFVNRVWEVYFGRGLTEPVDAFSAANPPTHPELLDALADEFVRSGYDIRALEASILNSDAWQRSSLGTASNQLGTRHYARFSLRVLPADVLVDAISTALADRQSQAVEEPRFGSPDENVQAYFNVFSRPERQLTCDCERSFEPTLRQSMLLLSDSDLQQRITSAIAHSLAGGDLPLEVSIEELFLRSLSRRPDEEEKQTAWQYVQEHADRQQALADVLWGLINTREFVTLN